MSIKKLNDKNCIKKCVICKVTNEESLENIKLFTEDSLKKCTEVLDYRLSLKYKRKSKYLDVILPREVNDIDGYHYLCYKTFNAITIEKNEEASIIPVKKPLTKSLESFSTSARSNDVDFKNTNEKEADSDYLLSADRYYFVFVNY